MNRNRLAATAMGLVLACGTLAGGVLAADGPGEYHEHEQARPHDLTRAEAEAGAQRLFDRLDANHDGKLDAADRTARIDAIFDRIDTNHDGTISREEFRAARQPGKGGQGEGWHDEGRHDEAGHSRPGGKGGWRHAHGSGIELARLIMHQADPNHTGTITREAFVAAALGLFDEADTNHDGTVTGEERAAERGRLEYRIHEQMRARMAVRAGQIPEHQGADPDSPNYVPPSPAPAGK